MSWKELEDEELEFDEELRTQNLFMSCANAQLTKQILRLRLASPTTTTPPLLCFRKAACSARQSNLSNLDE